MVEAKQIRGTAKTGTATIDFGAGLGDASVVVTGQGWIQAGSVVICHLVGESARIQSIIADADTMVPGVGFTIHAHAPHRAYGLFDVQWIGA